jgi:hypothetical protein
MYDEKILQKKPELGLSRFFLSRFWVFLGEGDILTICNIKKKNW